MYKDDWAIANVANLGGNWTLESGTDQRIVTQAAVGNSSGTTAAFYRYSAGKVASDHMRLDTGLITPTAGSLNTGVGMYLLARMPNTFATAGAAGTYVVAGLTSAGAWSIQSVNQTTFTSQASGSIGTITLPGIFSLIAAGPIYMALWNGTPISSGIWTDTSNTVASIGSTKRNWGCIVQCSNANQQHPSLDWASAHDLSGQFFAA